MNIGVLVLPILILVALALGVLVYFICYKAAINRKLRAEESSAHVPMASVETVIKVVVIIGALVLYGSLNSKVTKLQNDLTDMRIVLTDYIAAMQYDLYEMKERVKKEASMFSEIFYDFGEIDTKQHTVQMNFRVAPKSYSAETTVTLRYRGESIALTNNGDGTFTGSTIFPMFEESYEEGMIYLNEGVITKTEAWEDAPTGSLSYECLPQLLIKSSSFGYQKEKDSVRIEGELHIMSSENDVDQFRNLTLYVKKGNKIVEAMVLEEGHVVFDREYPVKDGDCFQIYVTGVDAYGYTHKEYITGWSTDEMEEDAGYMEEQQVICPE